MRKEDGDWLGGPGVWEVEGMAPRTPPSACTWSWVMEATEEGGTPASKYSGVSPDGSPHLVSTAPQPDVVHPVFPPDGS